MTLPKENIYNIPNLLSGYRLVAFPFILYDVCTGNERMFSTLLCINLGTDILDGLIARGFNLQTRFGARLDSLADISTYILAVCGIFVFKWHYISRSAFFLWLFLGSYLLAYIVSFIRFGKFPSLHLYSCKIGGYIQGVFFFVLFYSGYVAWLFKLAMIWGILSYLEETAVLVMLSELRSNCRGIYWVARAGN